MSRSPIFRRRDHHTGPRHRPPSRTRHDIPHILGLRLTTAGRYLAAILLVGSFVAAWPSPASAHRDDCHRWHSCPSDTGSYVCGDLGYFSECGYSSLPKTQFYDSEAPKRPKVSGPKPLAKGKVSITVTAERGSTLVIESEGKTVHKAVATGGAQTLKFKGLDGSHDYEVSATDSSDNTSSVATFTATADSQAPSTEGASIAAGSPQNAYAIASFETDEPVKYSVSVDGEKQRSGRTEDGDVEVRFPVDNGKHDVVLTLTDEAGNKSVVKQHLSVDIAELAPTVSQGTKPNEATQRFTITGTPGSEGTLKIAGQTLPVKLTEDSVDVALDLPDGEYANGTLDVTDEVGRTGTVAVPSFVVDTVKPTLTAVRRNNDSDTGHLVAVITAEKDARVTWRIVDDAGDTVESASYVATGQAHIVDVDADEGTVELVAEAVDEAGNSSTDTFTADVAADPLTVFDWIVLIVILAALVLSGGMGWKRRGQIKPWLAKQQHARHVRKAQRAHTAALQLHDQQLRQHAGQVADYRQRLSAWSARERRLSELRHEARTFAGTAPASTDLLGAKVKRDELVYAVVDGSLIEQRSRQNVPTLVTVERGRVAITSVRVLFQGPSKSRDWAYDKLEHQLESGTDTTLLKVSNRKTLSGVSYNDPERTRILLALAIDPSAEGRQQVVAAIDGQLRDHARAHPVAPPDPPPPPPPPAILSDAREPATSP